MGITFNDVIRYAKKAFKVRLTRLLRLPPIQPPTVAPLIPPIQLMFPNGHALPLIPHNPTLNPIPIVLITLRQFWKKYQAKQQQQQNNQQQQQGGYNQGNHNQQYYDQNQQYNNNQSPYPTTHQGQQQGGAWAGHQQQPQQSHKPSGGGYGAHDGPATVS